MPLTPGYGETPLPHDELDALLPEVIEILDKPITRADVYDVEQGMQDQVVEELMPAALDGSRPGTFFAAITASQTFSNCA